MPEATAATEASPPRRMAPPGNKSKLFKLGALGLVLFPFVFSVFSYNTERNVRARIKVAQACTGIGPKIERAFGGDIGRAIFAQDAPELARGLSSAAYTRCEVLDHALAWWRFNVAITLEGLPSAPMRASLVRDARTRIDTSCTSTVANGSNTQDARAICGTLRDTIVLLTDAPRHEVWEAADDQIRLAEALDRAW